MIGFIFLVGFPDQLEQKKIWPPFLNSEEIAFIIRRINKDRSDADAEEFNFKKWAASGKDPKVWSFALVFLWVLSEAI